MACEISRTLTADLLAVKYDHVVGVSAENTGGLVFLEDNAVSVNEDFYAFSCGESECSSCFDGKNKSSELVDLSYDSK